MPRQRVDAVRAVWGIGWSRCPNRVSDARGYAGTRHRLSAWLLRPAAVVASSTRSRTRRDTFAPHSLDVPTGPAPVCNRTCYCPVDCEKSKINDVSIFITYWMNNTNRIHSRTSKSPRVRPKWATTDVCPLRRSARQAAVTAATLKGMPSQNGSPMQIRTAAAMESTSESQAVRFAVPA